MPFTWSQTALFLAVGAFVSVACYLIAFLRRAHLTLKQTDETLSTIRGTLTDFSQQIAPVISRIGDLEGAAQNMISDINSKLDVLDREIVPLVRELKDTARAYRQFENILEEKVNQDLSPLIRETNEIAVGIKQITSDIQNRVRQTEGLFEAAEETGQTLKVASGIVRTGLTGLAVQVASIATGMKTSLEFLSENLVTKGGGKQ